MDALSQVPLTMCVTKAVTAAGTTTTVSTTNAITGCIKGKAVTHVAFTNQATPTTDATNAAAFPGIVANQGTVVVLGIDASGNLKASQGATQALDAAGNFIVAPQFPAVPDTVMPFAYLVLKGGATLSGTFTFGSSNLSGVTGMTYTFVDIMTLPDRPQVA